MSDRLPEGWVSASLGEIVEHVPNIKPEDHPARTFHYIDISSIDNSAFRIVGSKTFRGKDAPSRARRPLLPGDVLFSNVRTYLRNIAVVPEGSPADVCSTGFTVLRPTCAVDPQYLFRYVLTDAFIERVTPQQTGTHYPATSDRVVLAEPIPLPPLAEQRRIIAAVEAVLARVEAARERLNRLPAMLKRFRQAVLATACSGRLTADWREEQPKLASAAVLLAQPNAKGDPGRRAGRLWGAGEIPELSEEERISLPDSWVWAKVRDLGDDPSEAVQVGPMSMQSKDFADKGVPVLNVGCVQWGQFDESKLDHMPEEKAGQFARYRIRAGDILFTRSGTIGRCAVAGKCQEGYLMTFHLLRARPTARKVLSRYLLFVFQGARHIRRQMEDAAIGSTRPGFNTNLLGGLDVPLLSLPEQHEIVRRVEALFRLADAIERRVAGATARADKLTQAILAQAFRGELVPTEAELARAEGRDYEPASALLERVRSERETNSVSPKRNGRRRKS
jgi:type I restriction enzyme S subunit